MAGASKAAVSREPADGELHKVASSWKEVLKELSAVVDGAKQLATNWQVLSVPLAALAPKHFPVVAPERVKGDVGKMLLLEERYKARAEVDQYIELIHAFRVLRDAQVDMGLRMPEGGLRTVSAWLWFVHGLYATTGEAERLLRRGHRVILQGPPGTGKTYAAEELLKKLCMNEQVPVRGDKFDAEGGATPEGAVVYDFVQFHATYDYEDFVRGYRARGADGGLGFELVDGPFAKMATRAIDHPKRTFVLVIDEINRADLSRVLGECIYLFDRVIGDDVDPKTRTDGKVEERKKKVDAVLNGALPGAVRLRYVDTNPSSRLRPVLCVPANFLIIGTMNTADRSIALVDLALRRRFSFVDLLPDRDVITAFNRDELKDKDHKQRAESLLESVFDRLNGVAVLSEPLITDERYRLGHSYFLHKNMADLDIAMKYQVLPLLEEYRREGLISDGDGLESVLDVLRGK